MRTDTRILSAIAEAAAVGLTRLWRSGRLGKTVVVAAVLGLLAIGAAGYLR